MKNAYWLVPTAIALFVVAHQVGKTVGTPQPIPPPSDEQAFLGSLDWNLSAWGAAPPGRCPDGHVFAARIGSGGVPRLGRARAVATHCLNLADMSFTNGRLSIVAANGDELHGTYHGHTLGKTPQFGWVSHLDLNGGTGRFAEALGYAEEVGRGTLMFDSSGGAPVGGDGWSKVTGKLRCGGSVDGSASCWRMKPESS